MGLSASKHTGPLTASRPGRPFLANAGFTGTRPRSHPASSHGRFTSARPGGGAALSGWFEAGREPGVAAEEVAEGVEFADAPFRGGGQVGLDEREFGESFEGPPAASGAALLDLDGPDRPLGFVVGEDVQVRAGGEPQDQVLEAEEAAGEPAGVFGGGGPAVEIGGQARRRPVPGSG